MEPVIYSVNHIATSSLQLPDLIYIMNFTSKLLPALLQAWEHRAEHLCVFVAGKKHLFILVKCPALNTPSWLDTLVVSPAFSQNPGLPEKGRKSRPPKMPVLHPFLSQQLGWGRSECCAGAGYRELHVASQISPLSPQTVSSILWPFPILFMA